MDLDELRTVQAGERSTDSLQALRDSFYRDVAEYINGLREERARAAERADDPFGSDEVRHLTDEIETAQEVAEAIYDRRLGKVVKRASLAAAGMPTDEEGLTDEEAELFAAVVAEIESRRGAVLSAFAGEDEMSVTDAGSESHPGASASDANERAPRDSVPRATAPDPPPDTAVEDAAIDARGESAFDASEAMSGGTAESEGPPGATRDDDRSDGGDDREQADPEGATPDGGRLAADRTTVRITRDVGEIMGVDEHVYDLTDGDVATLPSANAEPLLERGAASRIE
jgi:DNA replication factor GINS